MPGRPAGLFLVIFALALTALALLGAGAFLNIVFAMIQHAPPARMQPGMYYPTAQPLFAAFMVGMIAVLYLTGAWTAGTAGGLLQGKRWALLSARALAGLATGLGLLLIFVALIHISVNIYMRSTPRFNPHAAQVFLIVVGSGAAIFLPFGSWMLFYLAKSPIQGIFVDADSREAQLAPRQPALPKSLLTVALLLLLGAALWAIYTFSHPPTLVFGFIMQGTYASLIYASLAVSSASLGLGLLNRNEWARLGTMAFITFGVINNLILLTPEGRAKFAAYVVLLQAHTPIILQKYSVRPTATIQPYSGFFWLSSTCSLLFGCWTFYKLHQNRHLFSRLLRKSRESID